MMMIMGTPGATGTRVEQVTLVLLEHGAEQTFAELLQPTEETKAACKVAVDVAEDGDRSTCGIQRAEPSTPSPMQLLGLARGFAGAQVRSGTAAVHGEPGLR